MALRDCFHKLRKEIRPDDRATIIASVADGTAEKTAVRNVLAEAVANVLAIVDAVEIQGGIVQRRPDMVTELAAMQMRILDALHQERLNLNDEINEVSIEQDMIAAVEARIVNYPEQRGISAIPTNLEDPQAVQATLSAMFFDETQREVFAGGGLGGFIKGTGPTELMSSWEAMQQRKFALAAKARSFDQRHRALDEREKTIFYGERRNPRKLYQDIRVEVPWKLKSKGDGDLYIRRHGKNAGTPFRERQGPNDFAISFDPEVLLPDYMFYLLTYLQPKIAERARGTAQQAIRLDDINAVLVNHFMGQELFQDAEGNPRLQVLHNLTSSDLAFADSFGGLAMPSVAVIPEDRALTSFGEITLIGKEELGDPQKVPLFDADAYAVRTPRAQHKAASREAVEMMATEAGAWSLRIEGSRYVGLPDHITEYARRRPNAERLVDHMMLSNSAKAWFLNDQFGEDPEPKVDDVRPGFIWGWQPSIMKFFETADLSLENLAWEDPRRVSHMRKAGRAARRAIREHHIHETGIGKRDRSPEAEGLRAEVVWQRTQRFIEIAGIINEDGTLSQPAYDRLKRDAARKGSTQINDVDTQTYLDDRIWQHGAENQFKAWVDAKVHGIMGEGRIKIGNRWYPHNMENVLRKMRGKLVGTETQMPSEGLLRAKAAKRIKNLDEARRRALEQIDTPEAVQKARDVSQKMMLDWIDALRAWWPYNPTSLRAMSDASDAAREATLFWVQNKDNLSETAAMRRGLERAGYVGPFPDEVIQQGLDASAATISNPVPYFEAKPQRAVLLNEFAGAVIPLNADPDTRALLQKHGIPTVEYKPGDTASRMMALFHLQSEINKKGGETLFQSELGLFSGLLVAAQNMPREKGTGADMLGTLMKQPGARKAEAEYIGVPEWLEAKGKEIVTRDQVATFIERGGLQVEETLYAGVRPESYNIQMTPADENAYDAAFDTPEEGQIAFQEQGYRIYDVTDSEMRFDETFRIFEDPDAGNVSVVTDQSYIKDDGRIGTREHWLDIDAEVGKQYLSHAEVAIHEYVMERRSVEGAAGFAKWTMYTLDAPQRGAMAGIVASDAVMNHREIVLHMPEIVPVVYTMENLEEVVDPSQFPAETSENFWFIAAQVPFKTDTTEGVRNDQVYQILKKDYPTIEAAKQYILDEKQPSTDFAYNMSVHGYDELNIMGWGRVTDRRGPNGERIMFIEELQSPLHQWGGKQGYRGNPAQIAQAKAKVESFRMDAIHAIRDLKYLGFDTFEDAISALREEKAQEKEARKAGKKFTPWHETYDVDAPHLIEALNNFLDALEHSAQMDRRESQAPLDFPFKGNAWIELVMKRIIRLAAEGGYDQIAWTTGDQQNDRYSLAHIAHKITFDPIHNTLTTYNEEGLTEISQHVAPENLADWIGAEPALEIKKQITEGERRWEVVPGTNADVTRGDIYGRLTDNPDDPYQGSVLMDENGELHRDMGGTIIGSENLDRIEDIRNSILWADEPPSLTGEQIVGEDRGLIKLYDKVFVNVMNKVARKLDPKAKARGKSIVMEGGMMPHKMRLESDGETFYISGIPPELPIDAPRQQLSPRFATMKEADAWRDSMVMGYANVQHGMTLTADIMNGAILGQSYLQKHRASITFDSQRRAIIRMSKARDLSSYLHESAHMWLDIMGDSASQPDAHPRIVDDWAKILKHLGVNDRREITSREHEVWAKTSELYFKEGIAPTHELQPLYSAFSQWLIRVYTYIQNYFVGIELTDEIRGVMDRMVATDEAISQAEQVQQLRPMFATAEEANLSPEAFEVYRKNGEDAHEAAFNKEHRKQLAYVHRQATAWWRDERAKVEEQVTAKVHAMPVYIALAHLQKGQLPDGSPAISPGPFKLSKESMLRYAKGSQEFLKRFPGRGRSGIYRVKGGVDADVAAKSLGFPDGATMLEAILNSRPMDELIQFETDELMNEQFPDPLVDGTLAADALVAVHNDLKAKVLAAELRALRKLIKRDEKIVGAERRAVKREEREAKAAAKGLLPKRAELAIIKKLAADFISKMAIRDVNPHKYRLAEQKAGNRAFAALEKKDYVTAYDERLKQIRNHEAFRVAVRAKEEAARTQKYLSKFEKKTKQKELHKHGLLDPILAVIEGIDLRKRSLAEVDRNTAMADILKAVEQGHIIVPQETLAKLADLGTNWQDLTVQEFREMRQIVEQLEHMPKRAEVAMVNDVEVVLEDVETEIAESMKAVNKQIPFGTAEDTGRKSGKASIKEGVYHALSVGSIARILDAGDWGALTRLLVTPIRRASVEKMIPMMHKYQEDVANLYLKHYNNEERGDFGTKNKIEGVTEEYSRSDVLSIALNWGSETNRAALLGGVVKDIDGNIIGPAYPQAEIMAALATLDARDWAFVQDVWDYLNTYWAQTAAAEKRRRGVAPQKVESLPFTINTVDGVEVTLRGGYYHLFYNPKFGDAVKADTLDDIAKKMGQGLFVSASTRAGATYNRVRNHGRVVQLGLSTIDRHLRETIRDIAIGDEVNYVMRLLNSDKVRRSFTHTNNEVALRELVLWATDAAVGELPAQGFWENVAGWSRVGFTKSKLAFSITVTLLQFTGAFQSMAHIGKKNFMMGFGKFLQNPAGHYKYVMDNSVFMNTRYGVMQRFSPEVADAQTFMKSVFGPVPTQFSRNFKAFSSKYFWFIAKAQSLVDVWTWMGAYDNGRNNKGLSETEARLFADSQVEGAQTSGIFADRSALERGTMGNRTRQSQYVRLFTTLIAYMLRKQGLGYEATQRYKRSKRTVNDAANLLIDYVMLFMVEGMASQLVYGNWPKEDDEEKITAYNAAVWVALATADSFIAGIPLVREITTARYGSGNTPIGSLGKDLWDVVIQASQGEVDKELMTTTISAAGTAFHLPSSQVNRAIEAYLSDDPEWYEYFIGVRK